MKCRTEMDPSRYLTKDMYHAVLKLVLLTMIKEKKTYTYDMLKHISKIAERRHFPKNSNIKSDIYNTIASLENAGYVKVQEKLEQHRIKKYYSITPRGAAALRESRKVFSDALRSVNSIISE